MKKNFIFGIILAMVAAAISGCSGGCSSPQPVYYDPPPPPPVVYQQPVYVPPVQPLYVPTPRYAPTPVFVPGGPSVVQRQVQTQTTRTVSSVSRNPVGQQYQQPQDNTPRGSLVGSTRGAAAASTQGASGMSNFQMRGSQPKAGAAMNLPSRASPAPAPTPAPARSPGLGIRRR